MGQQQLLLVVLSTIIVGLSIVVGINMFSTGAVQANVDAVTQDNVTIASRAQEWWRKPTQLGGGGRTWANIDAKANGMFSSIAFPETTLNGIYDIAISGSEIVITGLGVEDGDGNGTPVTVITTADSARIVSTNVTER